MERLGESVYRVQKRRRSRRARATIRPPGRSTSARAPPTSTTACTGRDASFWVRNLPLIPWFPFLAAAIRRERQTGFLFPKFGYSSSKGVFAEFPFFWAIDDSQDLTVAAGRLHRARRRARRCEYRYILSREQRGPARPASRVNESAQRRRHAGRRAPTGTTWQVDPSLPFKVDVNVVTDDQVLRDYGDQLYRAQPSSARRPTSS